MDILGRLMGMKRRVIAASLRCSLTALERNKEILAHLIEWDRETIKCINSVLAGEEPSFVSDDNEFNRAACLKWSGESLERILISFEQVSTDLNNAYNKARRLWDSKIWPDREETIRSMIQIDKSHHEEHARELESMRGNK